MDKQINTLHTIGLISIITTFITQITDNSIIFSFFNQTPTIMVFATLHYSSFCISIILYLVMVAKISQFIGQKLLAKFFCGLLIIGFSICLFIIDFGIATGVFAKLILESKEPTLLLVIVVAVVASFLICLGVFLICKTYIAIANYTNSSYFRFSYLLIILAAILFFIFIYLWILVPAPFSDNLKFIFVASGIGFVLSYNIGQIMFSIGAFKFQLPYRHYL